MRSATATLATIATGIVAFILSAGDSAAQPPALPGYKGTPPPRTIQVSREARGSVFAKDQARASVFAKTTLYDQMGADRGTGVNSQNYETFYDAYDDEAADDFTVPAGMRWKITEVDMAGYYNEGPADSMRVAFYTSRHGRPGRTIAQFTVVPPDNGVDGSFPLDLGGSVTLKPGHYWLSIQANQVFDKAGQWSWASQDGTIGAPAMWRNPGDGFETGCVDWSIENICVPLGEGDHLFALKGRVR